MVNKTPIRSWASAQSVVCVGGEASTDAIRKTLGTFKHRFLIYFACSWTLLVTMQDVVNEINKMNRVLSHLVYLDSKHELA